VSSQSLGDMLRAARAAHALSLHAVAERAGCSSGYVHKLESDKVRTPSPRVLAGLGDALGLPYRDLMTVAGYDEPAAVDARTRPAVVGAIKHASNAHIVELLEQLQRDVQEIRLLVAPTAGAG
jgi:transcriptional regulator with XRE-family HTH domain